MFVPSRNSVSRISREEVDRICAEHEASQQGTANATVSPPVAGPVQAKPATPEPQPGLADATATSPATEPVQAKPTPISSTQHEPRQAAEQDGPRGITAAVRMPATRHATTGRVAVAGFDPYNPGDGTGIVNAVRIRS